MVWRSALRAKSIVSAAGLLVGGCASPGKPVSQTVQVETPGCAAMACELSNDQGRWTVPRTPGAVSVTTSSAPLTVSCGAHASIRSRTSAPSTMAAASGGGAMVGGVAGGAAVGTMLGAAGLAFLGPVGVLVVIGGAAAGAAAGQAVEAQQQAIRYPELISVPMNCAPLTAPAVEPGQRLGLGIQGMPLAEVRAAGLREHGAVRVTMVKAGGAAAIAGLQPGDIVLAADGHELGDAADLAERVWAAAPGAAIALRVWRDGGIVELALTRPLAVP